jgi:hypothetical protein
VAAATAEAAELHAKGISREQAFEELREARQEIGKHL